MKQHLKSYIGLIVSFVHLINRNHLWPQQIRRGKQILPKQNHLCTQLHHLYFIILRYKGRKDTIVPGGSQFTRNNLSVSLCLKEIQNEFKSGRIIFVCVARYNSSWSRENQPFHTISEKGGEQVNGSAEFETFLPGFRIQSEILTDFRAGSCN